MPGGHRRKVIVRTQRRRNRTGNYRVAMDEPNRMGTPIELILLRQLASYLT